MDAIEKAIRNAFAKGDPGNRAFREKVYRSAFSVLEKALTANPNMTPAIAARRREDLSATISSIETEFLPAVAAPPTREPSPARPEPVVEPEPIAVRPTRPEPDFEPSLDGEERYQQYHDNDAGSIDDDIDPPERQERPRRSGRWAAVFIFVTLASLVAMGLWWAVGTGMFQSAEERDGSVPNPPALGEEDFTPEGTPPPPLGSDAGSGPRDWIAIFDPADPTTVSAPGDSSVEAMTGDGEAFVRIRSGASGSPVLFDVGPGVLETIAGGSAIFNIVAQTEDGQETQISVECSLGELGDCGRKRYAVGVTREEFLFEVNTTNASPGSGGTIAINSDIEGGGRSVDIYAIRVSVAQ